MIADKHILHVPMMLPRDLIPWSEQLIVLWSGNTKIYHSTQYDFIGPPFWIIKTYNKVRLNYKVKLKF